MRVLFLTHSYPRTPGDAAGSFLWHLAVALRLEDVEVHVVAPSADRLPARESIGDIPVDRFRYAPRRFETLAYTGNMATEVQRSLSAKLALVGFLGSEFVAATRVRREFEPHLIHAHWWFPGGLVGTWSARLAGVPLITTMHGTDVRLARGNSVARPLLKHVLQHSRAVTTVSKWLASEVTDMVPTIVPRVMPMPAATHLFSPGNTQRLTDRLLFVGRLNAQKGIARLIEALGSMTRRFELDIVGHGPDQSELQAQAERLGISDRLHWQGVVPQTQLPDLYRRATALVIPSIGEGLGLVAAEAQLCETPVVAFASGGILDTVIDGETGLLVPPGDTLALASTIDLLLGDAGLQRRLAAAGRARAMALFSPESAARRYAELYRSVAAP